jgi:hypothetical protein
MTETTNYYLIERAIGFACTYNFTLEATSSEAAIAAARNLGIEPLACRLYDRPYRLNQTTPEGTS